MWFNRGLQAQGTGLGSGPYVKSMAQHYYKLKVLVYVIQMFRMFRSL